MPTRSGSAPNCSPLTFQSLSNVKPITPALVKAGRASPTRRMKKYTIRARIRIARAMRLYFSARSGRRAIGDRARTERPPMGTDALSMAPYLSNPKATASAQPLIAEPLHCSPDAAALDFSRIDAGSEA